MTSLIHITSSKASSCDINEDTTYGFCVDVQIGPVVFAFWTTSLPFWQKWRHK